MHLRRAVAATTFAGEAALREDAVHLADRADVRTLIRQLVISSGRQMRRSPVSPIVAGELACDQLRSS